MLTTRLKSLSGLYHLMLLDDPQLSNLQSPLEKYWPDIIRALGVVIALWQLLIDQVDRPYLLAFAGGCIGLKEVKRWQDKRNGNS